MNSYCYKQIFLLLFVSTLIFINKARAEIPFINLGKQSLKTESQWSNSPESMTRNEMQVIPEGNLGESEIPEFPSFTKIYIRAMLAGQISASLQNNPTQFAVALGKQKIKSILVNLESQGLIAETKRVAKIFKIDPIHILGPIIGENSFNGSIDRTLQDRYVKMFQQKDFNAMNAKMNSIIDGNEIQTCMKENIRNYWKWRCIIYYSTMTANNSNRDLLKQYYSISGKGTFGIGQVQPFLLWSYNDLVHEKLGYPLFNITDSQKPMKIIFNNKEMLAYIGAMIYTSINIYRQFAKVDISRNPGLTTTLYNLGDEYQRAYYFNELKQQEPTALPQVNYMGWYVNRFAAEIRAYLNQQTRPLNNN